MSFKFNFDLDEDEIDTPHSSGDIPARNPCLSPRTPVLGQKTRGKCDCYHCTLEELLETLPPSISYSSIPIPSSLTNRNITISQQHVSSAAAGKYLLRRDLHDARFQLASLDLNDDTGSPSIETSRTGTAERGDDVEDKGEDFVSAETDLIPGLYEGGLKTWEGGMDLVSVMNDVPDLGLKLRGKRILELGCGTAMPSCYVLSQILSITPPSSTSTTTLTSTVLHLQDYNKSVLSLVTLPNLILACLPYLHPSFPSASGDTNDGGPGTLRMKGDLEITSKIKEEFVDLLRQHRIELKFTYGSWEGMVFDHQEGKQGDYDLIYSAETIYNLDNVDSLINVLKTSAKPSQKEVDSERSVNGQQGKQDLEDSMGDLSLSQEHWADDILEGQNVSLIAAKVLYFGVGGGLQEFIQLVQERGAETEVVKEWLKGVGRKVVRLRWI